MEMAIREKHSGDVGRARELMKRMLRRVIVMIGVSEFIANKNGHIIF